MKISLPTLLFVVFLTLKLCSVIDWSWWWITAPLWVPIAFFLLLIPGMMAAAYAISKEEGK